MLNVSILSVVMLNVIMLSVVMMSAVMLIVIMLSVIMLSVVTLSVLAPVKMPKPIKSNCCVNASCSIYFHRDETFADHRYLMIKLHE
jgi:hypothetical protein